MARRAIGVLALFTDGLLLRGERVERLGLVRCLRARGGAGGEEESDLDLASTIDAIPTHIGFDQNEAVAPEGVHLGGDVRALELAQDLDLGDGVVFVFLDHDTFTGIGPVLDVDEQCRREFPANQVERRTLVLHPEEEALSGLEGLRLAVLRLDGLRRLSQASRLFGAVALELVRNDLGLFDDGHFCRLPPQERLFRALPVGFALSQSSLLGRFPAGHFGLLVGASDVFGDSIERVHLELQ